jgi:hypothetical protein
VEIRESGRKCAVTYSQLANRTKDKVRKIVGCIMKSKVLYMLVANETTVKEEVKVSHFGEFTEQKLPLKIRARTPKFYIPPLPSPPSPK